MHDRNATTIPTGLSPRARGSLIGAAHLYPAPGSIPAGAGKPWPWLSLTDGRRVYPRGRGEAITLPLKEFDLTGLSPRARGSLVDLVRILEMPGSIPAGAGKPRIRRRRARLTAPGLSPRARGSRVHGYCPMLHPSRGSIPAGAGKPPSTADDLRTEPSRVYPRGRGEAAPQCAAVSADIIEVYPRGRGEASSWNILQAPLFDRGLSPRARGSRERDPVRLVPLRSIPAGAGKPHQLHGPSMRSGVYPRGRGEAGNHRGTDGKHRCAGLSPRARGSLICDSSRR